MTDDPVRRIAGEIERRGLSAPARLFVDAHLPLAPLLSDTSAALHPLLRLSGLRATSDLVRLLDDETGLERLIAQLDHAGERNAESG